MKGKRRIDRVTDPSYLEGLERLDEDRIRAMREECEEEEAVLSYERSLLHGRLNILKAEQQRRANGGSPGSLVDRLPEILTGGRPRTHRGAFPKLDPPALYDPPRRRVERLLNDDTLARLPDLDDAELASITRTLEQAERELSESRRTLLRVIDRLVEEIARRLASRT